MNIWDERYAGGEFVVSRVAGNGVQTAGHPAEVHMLMLRQMDGDHRVGHGICKNYIRPWCMVPSD